MRSERSSILTSARWINVMVDGSLTGWRVPWLGLWATLWLAASGCGQQAGILMYHMGLVKPKTIPAEFELPKAPLLILVDDDWDLVHPRTARDALVDALAKELKTHGLIERATTNEELARIRQSEPDFEQRGAREVGRLAKADTVLWLKVVRFALEDDLELAVSHAHFAVTVKVLDARADKREAVRLWPKGREGKLVEAKISPHDIRKCKTTREAHAAMAGPLAQKIAQFFYEHPQEP